MAVGAPALTSFAKVSSSDIVNYWDASEEFLQLFVLGIGRVSLPIKRCSYTPFLDSAAESATAAAAAAATAAASALPPWCEYSQAFASDYNLERRHHHSASKSSCNVLELQDEHAVSEQFPASWRRCDNLVTVPARRRGRDDTGALEETVSKRCRFLPLNSTECQLSLDSTFEADPRVCKRMRISAEMHGSAQAGSRAADSHATEAGMKRPSTSSVSNLAAGQKSSPKHPRRTAAEKVIQSEATKDQCWDPDHATPDVCYEDSPNSSANACRPCERRSNGGFLEPVGAAGRGCPRRPACGMWRHASRRCSKWQGGRWRTC